MEKFEAGDKFLELFEKFPNEFSVTNDVGRDHNCIIIRNNYRAVEIVLDVSSTNATTFTSSQMDIIRFVRQSTIDKLHVLAKEKLEQDKIQRIIDSDNKAINILLDYYKNK